MADMPTMAAAPGLFSMTTGWPNFSVNPRPIMRASVSAAPPAAAGTIMRIGLSGYGAAQAAVAAMAAQERARLCRMRFKIVSLCLLCVAAGFSRGGG
jgi:hypothetical protein